MRNAEMDESQAGIKIAGRNINNLRYTDDTTLRAESKEELGSLLMKVKEENEKAGLKVHIQKTKIMASGPIISWQIDGETTSIMLSVASIMGSVSFPQGFSTTLSHEAFPQGCPTCHRGVSRSSA